MLAWLGGGSSLSTSLLHWEALPGFVLMVLCRGQPLQSYLTLCNPMDYRLPGSSVHGILQARLLEWVALSSSRGSSPSRDGTCTSYVSCIGGRLLYHSCHPGSPHGGRRLSISRKGKSPNSHTFQASAYITHDTISLAKTGHKEFEILEVTKQVTKLILSLSERNSKVTSQKHKHLEWEEFVATFQSAIATNEPRKMFTLNFTSFFLHTCSLNQNQKIVKWSKSSCKWQDRSWDRSEKKKMLFGGTFFSKPMKMIFVTFKNNLLLLLFLLHLVSQVLCCLIMIFKT